MIMATTAAAQAVEKNITSVALANIQPSNYNPRKNFDETSLAELAESIRQQGCLLYTSVRQPKCRFHLSRRICRSEIL